MAREWSGKHNRYGPCLHGMQKPGEGWVRDRNEVTPAPGSNFRTGLLL